MHRREKPVHLSPDIFDGCPGRHHLDNLALSLILLPIVLLGYGIYRLVGWLIG